MPRSMLSRRPLWLLLDPPAGHGHSFCSVHREYPGGCSRPDRRGRRQSHHPFGERRNREHDGYQQR